MSATDLDDILRSKSENELQGINTVGKVVGLLVTVWLASVSYYAFSFFVLGMLPSVIALIVDRGKGRFASQTITALNFVGILPFIFDIGLNYERSVAAREAMSDPFTWVVIYGFAVIGLMMIFILPNITAIFFTIKAEYKLRTLNAEQEALVEEWGEEVTRLK